MTQQILAILLAPGEVFAIALITFLPEGFAYFIEPEGGPAAYILIVLLGSIAFWLLLILLIFCSAYFNRKIAAEFKQAQTTTKRKESVLLALKNIITINPSICFEIYSNMTLAKIDVNMSKIQRKIRWFSTNRNPRQYETVIDGNIMAIEYRSDGQNSFRPVGVLEISPQAGIIRAEIRIHRFVRVMIIATTAPLLLLFIANFTEMNENLELSVKFITAISFFLVLFGVSYSFKSLAAKMLRDVLSAAGPDKRSKS